MPLLSRRERLRKSVELPSALCVMSKKHETELPQAATESTGGMADHDPAAWSEDFDKWRAENCAHREGKDDWGGIGALLVDFAEWCVARNSVPCSTRATFERLLRDAGFRLNVGMVAGLVLRADLEAVLRYRDSDYRKTMTSGLVREREGWLPARVSLCSGKQALPPLGKVVPRSALASRTARRGFLLGDPPRPAMVACMPVSRDSTRHADIVAKGRRKGTRACSH
jgi:hypothetical protein